MLSGAEHPRPRIGCEGHYGAPPRDGLDVGQRERTAVQNDSVIHGRNVGVARTDDKGAISPDPPPSWLAASIRHSAVKRYAVCAVGRVLLPDGLLLESTGRPPIAP